MSRIMVVDDEEDLLSLYGEMIGIIGHEVTDASFNGEEAIIKFREMLEKHTEQIHGMVHCSGGAQTKVLHFVDNLHIIKDNLFDVPPLFRLIQSESKTDWKEMYQVFNCGHRMELYVPAAIAEDLIQISRSFNIDAQVIGRVEKNRGKKLTITSEFGKFVYDS